ncbi:MAG: mycofactocin biosynthesis chaperone MftB [Actinomycetota bacterium]
MSTEIDRPIDDRRLRLHPRVALRPEPFGALAYHYGNRRLNFLRSPDLVTVVKALESSGTVAETLVACSIAPHRRPAFTKALAALAASDFLQPLDATDPDDHVVGHDGLEPATQ